METVATTEAKFLKCMLIPDPEELARCMKAAATADGDGFKQDDVPPKEEQFDQWEKDQQKVEEMNKEFMEEMWEKERALKEQWEKEEQQKEPADRDEAKKEEWDQWEKEQQQKEEELKEQWKKEWEKEQQLKEQWEKDGGQQDGGRPAPPPPIDCSTTVVNVK